MTEAETYKRRCEALEQLLAVYRTGARPSEKLFRELDITRRAIAKINQP